MSLLRILKFFINLFTCSIVYSICFKAIDKLNSLTGCFLDSEWCKPRNNRGVPNVNASISSVQVAHTFPDLHNAAHVASASQVA